MNDLDQTNSQPEQEDLSSVELVEATTSPEKTPISFLSGAITSGVLALLCFRISKAMVVYFTLHSPNYSSAIAQSVASGFKTLVIGTTFLATFTFAFIGLGLTLVFIRSLFASKSIEPD